MLAAGEYVRLRGLGEQGPGRDEDPRAKSTVKIKNVSGANRRLGEVLEVDDASPLLATIDPEFLWFNGVTPNAQRTFGILRDPVLANEIEQLQLAGVCKALVNFTHADHRSAYVESGSYVLRSTFVGPVQIVNKTGGTGEQECAVLLTPRDPMPAVVQIWDPSQGVSIGDLLLSDANAYHPGRIRQVQGKTMTTVQDAWVRIIDWHDEDAGGSNQNTIAEQSRYHVGMVMGHATSTVGEGDEEEEVTRPLVVIDLGDTTYLSQPIADINKGDPGDVRLYNRDETYSNIDVTAKALGFAVKEDKWTSTVRFRGGAWYVGCWEV